MAATIRFPDGSEATLVDEEGKWECADEDMKENLELRTAMLPHRYYPDWIHGVAHDIAREVGAEVIHVDPSNEGPLDPDAEY